MTEIEVVRTYSVIKGFVSAKGYNFVLTNPVKAKARASPSVNWMFKSYMALKAVFIPFHK